MSDTVMLSLRLPAKLAERLEKVAAATERPRSYVAVKAIQEYVESEDEILEGIRAGLAEADAGMTVSHEEAESFIANVKVGRRVAPRAKSVRKQK
jgi:predicted transcriptional regulator